VTMPVPASTPNARTTALVITRAGVKAGRHLGGESGHPTAATLDRRVGAWTTVRARRGRNELYVLPDRLLPMLPIEGVRLDFCQVDVVEAANVDAELVRVGSRHIEGVNAAMAAEGVLGGQRVEPVRGELFLATQ
jgi:hypothetical protein